MSRISGSTFKGACKFWNAVKGFGFITADDGGADLFISQQDLVTGDEGFRALVCGQRVECIYTVGDDGKAIGKNVTGPNGATLPSFKDKYTAKRRIEAVKPPDPNKNQATVKWFDAGKSFGFLVPSGGGADIFFHLSECLKGIVPAEGDIVEYATKVDKKGKTVASQIKNKTQKAPRSRPAPGGAGAGGAPGAPVAYSVPSASYAMPYYGGAPAGAPAGKLTGVCKFMLEKGYGFIIPDHGAQDIHVHGSNVTNGTLKQGDSVEYEEQLIKGRPQAVSVKIVPQAVAAKRRVAAAQNAKNAVIVPAPHYEYGYGAGFEHDYRMENPKRSRVAAYEDY